MTDEQKILLEEIRVQYQNIPVNRIICDETNNTSENIENGVVNITIMPYKSVEHIAFKFVVTKDD